MIQENYNLNLGLTRLSSNTVPNATVQESFTEIRFPFKIWAKHSAPSRTYMMPGWVNYGSVRARWLYLLASERDKGCRGISAVIDRNTHASNIKTGSGENHDCARHWTIPTTLFKEHCYLMSILIGLELE